MRNLSYINRNQILLTKRAMKRRYLIKYGLFGAGVLTASAVGLSLRETKFREPKADLYCFSLLEFSILAAIAECILPGDTFFPSASVVQVAENMDKFLSTTESYVQSDFKALLHLIENAFGNGLLELHPQTFTYSSPEEQIILLESWQHSSIALRRTAYKALNGLCQATYFGTAETNGVVGYDGPPPYLVEMVRKAGER